MRRPPRLTSNARRRPNSGEPTGLQNTGALTRLNLRRSSSTGPTYRRGRPPSNFRAQDPLPSSRSGSGGSLIWPASGAGAALGGSTAFGAGCSSAICAGLSCPTGARSGSGLLRKRSVPPISAARLRVMNRVFPRVVIHSSVAPWPFHPACQWVPLGRAWAGSYESQTGRADGLISKHGSVHDRPRSEAAMGRYEEVFRRSLRDPEAFWGEAARALRWRKPWERVLDPRDPKRPRWFQGGELNTCENALDVHVESGRAEQLALIWDSAVAGQTMKYTYRELLQETARFAGALRRLGVEKGDRVVIYMPMVPQAVITMLACARLGAVHSVVFGGFAAHELAARIEHAQPKVIVSASCGVEPTRTVDYKPMLDAALEIAEHAPPACVI